MCAVSVCFFFYKAGQQRTRGQNRDCGVVIVACQIESIVDRSGSKASLRDVGAVEVVVEVQ